MVFGFFKNKQDNERAAVKSRAIDISTTSAAAAAAGAVVAAAPPGFSSIRHATVLVTGACGLCGARLIEMCLERGAATVVAVDLQTPDETLLQRFTQKSSTGKVVLLCGPTEGDLTSDTAMEAAFTKVPKLDIVFHVGGLTGPFFGREEYMKVNYQGTLRVIALCQKYKVPKLIFAGTPSARFTGADITGQTEIDLPLQTEHWLIPYAESKALAEQAVQAAHHNKPPSSQPEKAKKDGDGKVAAAAGLLATLTVSPHQVYGPHDELFLGRILAVAGKDQLYIFGKGDTTISVTYVDNYVHGLLCGADALSKKSTNGTDVVVNVGGGSYIVTDDHPVQLWSFLNTFVTGLGFTDLETKIKLPAWILYAAAYVSNLIGLLSGQKLALSPFSVKMLTMHRYFDIRRAKQDLQYSPVVPYDKAVDVTLDWFKSQWLPSFFRPDEKATTTGVASTATTATTNSSTPVKTVD